MISFLIVVSSVLCSTHSILVPSSCSPPFLPCLLVPSPSLHLVMTGQETARKTSLPRTIAARPDDVPKTKRREPSLIIRMFAKALVPSSSAASPPPPRRSRTRRLQAGGKSKELPESEPDRLSRSLSLRTGIGGAGAGFICRAAAGQD